MGTSIFQPHQKVDIHLSDRIANRGLDHRGEYKVEFPYRVYVNNNSILMSDMIKVDEMTTGRWGWNFKPHPDEIWHDKQNAYMSFEKKEDAVQVRLGMRFNKD